MSGQLMHIDDARKAATRLSIERMVLNNLSMIYAASEVEGEARERIAPVGTGFCLL